MESEHYGLYTHDGTTRAKVSGTDLARTLAEGKRAVLVLPGTLVTEQLLRDDRAADAAAAEEKLRGATWGEEERGFARTAAKSMMGEAFEKSIRGMCAAVRNAIQRSEHPSAPEIFCIAYSKNDEASYVHEGFAEHARQNGWGKAAPKPPRDARDIVDEILLPAIGATGDHMPPLAEARERLSRLTIYAHSYGTIVAQQLGHTFYRALVDRGYHEQDAAGLVKEVLAISLANVAALDYTGPSFRTLSFCAKFDPTAYAAMRRIAETEYGASAENIDGIQDDLYDRAGYNHFVAHERLKLPATPAYTPAQRNMPPSPSRRRNGLRIVTDLPGELVIEREGKKPHHLTPELLEREYSPLRKLGADFEHTPVTPEHDLRMYTQPTQNGNALLVKAVDRVLSGAVNRDVSDRRSMGSDLEAMLADRTLRPPPVPARR